MRHGRSLNGERVGGVWLQATIERPAIRSRNRKLVLLGLNSSSICHEAFARVQLSEAMCFEDRGG